MISSPDVYDFAYFRRLCSLTSCMSSTDSGRACSLIPFVDPAPTLYRRNISPYNLGLSVPLTYKVKYAPLELPSELTINWVDGEWAAQIGDDGIITESKGIGIGTGKSGNEMDITLSKYLNRYSGNRWLGAHLKPRERERG